MNEELIETGLEQAPSQAKKSGFIAIVGRPNVGKSTLMNHIIGQKVSITSRKAQTTRHRILGILTEPSLQTQFVFVDTPGFQKQYMNELNRIMNRTVTQTLGDVNVILFVIEATHFDKRDAIVLSLLPKNIPVILVLNKVDKIKEKAQLLAFIETLGEKTAHFPFHAIVPLSAKNSRLERLMPLLTAVQAHLPETDVYYYEEDDITDRSEKFLAAELIREKLFRLLGDEIPYSTSVIIDHFETIRGLKRVFASILVDKDNQKAILLGKKGEKMKLIATQSRLDMENLFQSKVYLEVFVKVRSGWADDTQMLKQLGYE